MGADFDIKQGDRQPPFERTLSFAGTLTGASVNFFMQKKGDPVPTVAAPATIVDAALRKVRYDWGVSDTLTSGEYDAEFEVTFPSGQQQTFPADRNYQISIRPNLDTNEAAPPVPAAAGGIVSIRPIDGIQDDWPRLITTLQANAYKKAVMLLPGVNGEQWQCKSGGAAYQTPSGTVLYGTPSTTVVINLSQAGDGFSKAAFYAQSNPLGPGLSLFEDVVLGLAQIKLQAITNLTVGGIMTVTTLTANFSQSYKVVSISGPSGGAYTIVVDRPILYPFSVSGPKAAAAYAASIPRDIKIYGNGMLLRGTANRAVEISGAWDSIIEDVKVKAEGLGFNGFAMSFDVGALRCGYRRCQVDAAQTSTVCIAMESAEACFIEDCNVIYSGSVSYQTGFYVFSGRHVVVRNCSASNCSVGLQCDWDGGTVSGFIGSENCQVVGGNFYRNLNHGIWIQDGATGWNLVGVNCTDNFGCGIFIESDLQTSSQIRLTNCKTNGNSVDGVKVAAGVNDVIISNHQANGNVGYGINVASDTIVRDLVSRDCIAGAVSVTGSAVLQLSGFDLRASQNGFWIGVTVNTTGSCQISNGTFNMSGTGTKIAISHTGSTSFDRISNLLSSGGTYGYLNNTAGAGVKRGPGVDFSSAGTPFDTTSAMASFGTVTLNGASAVDYTFTGVRANSLVRLTRKTAGGTAGPPPVYTITAGTKVTVTGTAGDTSVYAIDID